MTASAPAFPQKDIVLSDHQQIVHDFLLHQPYGAAWLDVGAGKTLTVLSLLQSVRPQGHILVIAPLTIARSTWIAEIAKWGFPIRMKSLVVDENDKKLTTAQRLEAFAEVHTDPPTMYFINQEMLTRASQPESVLVSQPYDASPELQDAFDDASTEEQRLWSLVSDAVSVTNDELAALVENDPLLSELSKTRRTAVQRNLVRNGLLTRLKQDCSHCAGEGCTICKTGLIDQLPRTTMGTTTHLTWPFDTVIIDEAQAFSSHQSERFKVMKMVRPAIKRLIEITGTPASNGVHDLWSQMYLLDQGEALGKTITEFRRRWFTPLTMPGTTVVSNWLPKPNAEREIQEAIKHLVVSAENTSAPPPPLNPIQDHLITLPPDVMSAYDQFKRSSVLDLVRSYTDEDGKLTQSMSSIVAENRAVLAGKLQQFASGTVYTADPDDPSTKHRYEVVHREKLHVLVDLIQSLAPKNVLLPYHFSSDKNEIFTSLRERLIDVRVFDGSRAMVAQWNRGEIPVLMLHPESAGHGLNLQDGGSHIVWYTVPYSLRQYTQTNGRLHRRGQRESVTIHRLLARGTNDMRMPDVLAAKKRTQDGLISAVDGRAALDAALFEELNEEMSRDWLMERI